VQVAAQFGLLIAATIGLLFLVASDQLLGFFGLADPVVLRLGRELLRYLSVSGLFVTVALTYTGGLQGTGDTRSPLFISLASQIGVPIGLCTYLQLAGRLDASWIWLAIVLGHCTRALLSTWVFHRGRWRAISVDVRATSGRPRS
jgi:Na+-driven multidrug efflux pump